jgi:PAS domain S-box-containing protein
VQKPATKYGLTVVAVIAAAVVRGLLDPLLGDNIPYATFFAAVAFAAWLGGLRTGLLATLLGCSIALFLFVPPRFSLVVAPAAHLIGIAMFVAVGILIAFFGEALRTSQSRSVSAEKQARQQAETLRITFSSIGDAVITTDARGHVTYLNPVAEVLTGWTAAEANGKAITQVFQIVNEQSRIPVENPVEKVLKHGRVVGLANHTILIARDGTERPIDDSASPIRSEAGGVVGCVLVFKDITARHNAERFLRESEERAAFVRQAGGIGFWYCDLPFDLLQWDDLVKAHFHLPPDASITIETFYARIHPDDREPTRRAIERSIQDRTGYDAQYRTVAPDTGAVRWVRAIGRTFYTADGSPARFDGVTLDITEQKQAHDRLRQSEARLRRVFESNVVGMIRWDLDRSLILDANAEFLRMTGYTRDDVTGGWLNFRDLTPPEWTARNEQGIRAIRADGHAAPYEKEYFRKDGSRVPLIIAGTRFEDSPTEGMSFLIDISDAKRAEAQLRASELRLRLVVDSATDYAIFTMNPEGIIDGWNAGAERLFGYREAEVVGQHDRFLYTPDDAAQKIPEREMKKAADEGRAVNERWHVRKGGDRFWGSGLVQPLRDGVSVVGFLKIMRDMTEQQLLQQALLDADRRKDEFLATLAHELRNPLAPIRNGLQLMRLAGSDGEAVEQARSMMDRQLVQMVRLVDDLMDVSRITRGKLELKMERVQLHLVLNSAVETSRPLIEQMGHELIVTLPKEPIVVDADLTRLAQVFVNLLNNAAKYSDRGAQIRLIAERQGSDVVVTVKDNGIGIAADQLPHIFEMFTQVDRSLEKAQGGLGIGLTLVQRLVEMHAGQIEAHSDGPGKGSEFVVRLPVVVEASVPPKADKRHEGDMTSSLRILIVDDNRDSADSLAMMLKIMGNDTHTAYDGEEAVTLSDKFRPDVILLDIGLPKLNGYEACRRIRARSEGEKLVIIAQTGWGQDEDRQRTHDAGFDHHMVKPVDPNALMKMLAGLSEAALRKLGNG